MGRKLKYDKLDYSDYILVYFLAIVIIVFFIIIVIPVAQNVIKNAQIMIKNYDTVSLIKSTSTLSYFIDSFFWNQTFYDSPTKFNYTSSMDCYSYNSSYFMYCANTTVNSFSFKTSSTNSTYPYFTNYNITQKVCNSNLVNYSSATNCSYDNFSYIRPNYTYFSEHWKYYACYGYNDYTCEVTNSSTVNQYLIYGFKETLKIVKINNNNSS